MRDIWDGNQVEGFISIDEWKYSEKSVTAGTTEATTMPLLFYCLPGVIALAEENKGLASVPLQGRSLLIG